MTTATDMNTERIARLEGAYEHLATKADLSQLETRMVQMEARLTWRMIGVGGVIIAAMALIVRFL